MKKHDVLYFFPEYSMKWEGLHSLVVHPASLEVRRREEREERRGREERGRTKVRTGERTDGRKVNYKKCIGVCVKGKLVYIPLAHDPALAQQQ